jgi:hypothetical protein
MKSDGSEVSDVVLALAYSAQALLVPKGRHGLKTTKKIAAANRR